jgi:hypothetical protein
MFFKKNQFICYINMEDTPKLNFFVTLCPMLPYIYREQSCTAVMQAETLPWADPPLKESIPKVLQYSKYQKLRSRDSAVFIATSYGLDGFNSRQRHLSLLHVVQTGSGAHPAPSPGGRAAGT